MTRKLLLILTIVAALAVLVPAPSGAVGLGRICAGLFTSGADYGCEFDTAGTRVRVFGVALAAGPASATVWITATPNPTDEIIVSCDAPSIPLVSACSKGLRRDLPAGTLYCWVSGADRGVFGCQG